MGADHLYLELTSRCNLSCRHCYLSAGPNGRAELGKDVVRRALDDFAAAGGLSVTLSGGEPLLHPDWSSLAAHAVGLGLRATVATNGTLLEGEAADQILRLGVTVALSLDGASPATHDAVRGPKGWEGAMRGLSTLVRGGAGERVIACFTPNRRNVGELWPLAMEMRSRGVSHLYVSVLEDRGREQLHRGDLGLTLEDRVSLLVQIALLMGRPDLAIHLDAGHLKYFFDRLWNGWDGLGDPIEGTLRVNPEGRVYLTAYSDDDRLLLGELPDIAACWESDKARAILAEAVVRREGLADCSECPYWMVCGGGSPIRAFAAHGKLLAPDDFCESKQVFLERWFRAQ